MKPFLSFQGSRAGFFSDLFKGEPCPLRIPFDRPLGHELEAEWLRAAVSPILKSRKERRPPTRPPSTSSGPELAEGSSSRAASHCRTALHNAYSLKTIGFSSVPRLTGWFFQRLVYRGSLPPPHSLRQAQGCGFPHTQVAKRTAPSRQSLKKRFHGLAGQENSRQKRHPWP